ncbi:MAG: GNAT family N-acetyltransferase [Rhizobiales bacterium]|nr:GNAT family N-acetyltransferase [Hyphomicrobiales bacterium]
MRASPHSNQNPIRLRPAAPDDLDAVVDIENRAFDGDIISRRSLRRFLTAPSAVSIVAELKRVVAGYTLVLFRPHSATARLYSIAVDPDFRGHGIGPALIAAAEEAALEHDCIWMRLEVHENNSPAIARYRKADFRQFGRRPGYYEDHGAALLMEKRLQREIHGLKTAPPYRHQTTDFTCGPACLMMALAWAEPGRRLEPGLEFRLWREATTIFMTAGHGGCGPYGLAVAAKRRGLHPEVYINRPGPYFLDTVQSESKRRVMRLTQADMRHEAEALGIPTHATALGKAELLRIFDTGAVAIVLVSGYQLLRRRIPHWVFAFGHEGRYVLVHDPAAKRNDRDIAIAAETYAVPWAEFERMTRFGPDHLRAALVIRKGPRP